MDFPEESRGQNRTLRPDPRRSFPDALERFGGRCPRCGGGALFQPGWTTALRACCSTCGLDYTKCDSADGPAVLLIFILGALLVPLAFAIEMWLGPPLWVHALLWTAVVLVLTVVALRPLKAMVIALQYRYRPGDWDNEG